MGLQSPPQRMAPLFFAAVSFAILMSTILTRTRASGDQKSLALEALNEILGRAAPIAGTDEGCSKYKKTCNWMANFADNTKLVQMNLPGTHDTTTWNYSDATQASLIRYTGPIPPANRYRCQEHSILQSLNEGIRVFDLRIAYNPGNDTLGFWHSNALLAPTTRVEDVFIGIYDWLNRHPSEAVLVSINREGNTGTPNDAAFYEKLYNILNSPLAKDYWAQTNGTLGTLGEARGKLTLLQRFSWALLSNGLDKRFGIYLDGGHWTDNGKNIELTYNVAQQQVAYIEDYYDVSADLAKGSGATAYIQAKFNVTTAHITEAGNAHPDQLYISFASAAFIDDQPLMIPQAFASGTSGVEGMNQKLLPWLQARKGKRNGVVMLDFYDAVPGLVEAVIGL